MEGLEKILDKLGVFSILAVFVPGLVIGTDVFFLCEIVKINTGSFSELGLVFIIVSFLFGIAFYEIGYTLFAFTMVQDKILVNVIKGNNIFQRSPHLKLCEYEYNKVKEYINNTTSNTTNNTGNNPKQATENEKQDKEIVADVNLNGYRVYNYCKYRVKEHREKNSIVAMSRTLFLYFFCISVLAAIMAMCGSCYYACCDCKLWLFAAVHFALFIIFIIRTIRGYELMYATVIKEFYQTI